MQIGKRNRKAISPVLATVILIAITLIAAIAIAGFVFGLFGSFTSTANIAVTAASCYIGGAGHQVNATYAGAGCLLQFTNTGSSTGSLTGCSFSGTGGGVGTLESAGAIATITVKSGAHPTAYCISPASLATSAGTMASGSAAENNGGSALFSGTWQ